MGTTLDTLRRFPNSIKAELGHDLDLVQQGLSPRDYKPMSNLGHGIIEIRQRDNHGAFRLIYVAKFAERIYVLHVFQKKTQKTSPQDLNIIKKRYHALLEIENGH
nr:type II toxin-antitoxin system RelE/ParE family toxin [Pasteurella testudinis]